MLRSSNGGYSRSTPARDSIAAMSRDPPEIDPEDLPEDDPRRETIQKLIASVEELRALLAPLSPNERERVLELARWLKENPEGY